MVISMPSIKEFDYNLPKQLIAQEPSKIRHKSRLLVYHCARERLGLNERGFIEHRIEHREFSDIIDYLNKGDVIVINETKVMKTRLYGHKKSGGKVAITIVEKIGSNEYDVFVKCKNPKIGTELIFENGLRGKIINGREERFIVRFNKPIKDIIERKGDYTLPGYIHNKEYDRHRYQTVFANEHKEGSIAAPTAGLHFSDELIERLKMKGVVFAKVCLHVGIGTFNEVRATDYTKHKMHVEWVEVPDNVAHMINERKGKLFIVGTTSLRALETATDENGLVHPFKGFTRLFVYPGYRFKLKFDGMITNFHLPRSTLLLLIAGIIGNDWKRVYQEAIKKKYRFYSFGDAMLILRDL